MSRLSNTYRCSGLTQKKKRCKKWSKPNSIGGLCGLHKYQDNGPLRCFAFTKKKSRCSLVLSKPYDEYCEIHKLEFNDTIWCIGTKDTNVLGIFTSLDGMENIFTQPLNCNPLYTIENLYTQLPDYIPLYTLKYRKRYNLTEEMSPLKIKDLIDLINIFVGNDYLWILLQNKRISIVDIIHGQKDSHLYVVKANELFKLNDL